MFKRIIIDKFISNSIISSQNSLIKVKNHHDEVTFTLSLLSYKLGFSQSIIFIMLLLYS